MFRVVRRQPVCHAAFNGEFGNSRDASVHADDAKSRCPKRVAGALRRRNSLHMAIQIWVRACPRYRFGDCGPHSAQTEQGGETASLISLSQRPPISFRGATKCWPCLQPLSRCRDSCLRCCWQRDRDARAQGRVQRVVNVTASKRKAAMR